MNILDQINDNAITDVRLNDTEHKKLWKGNGVEQLIEALSKNTSIESIRFEGEFLGCVRSEPRKTLIETIGKLPNLHEVHMNESLLDISAMTKMIISAKNLRILKLNAIVFQGAKEGIPDCVVALHAHMSMKEFEMKDCLATDSSISLQPLELAAKKVTTVGKASTAPTSSIQVKRTTPVA